LATIRKDIDAGDDLEQLKAQVAEQQQRLEMLEARQDQAQDGDITKKDKLATRRQLLRLAGATLVGAAGAAALRAIPAAATNGQFMQVGTIATQDLSNETGLNLIGSAAPGRAFHVLAGNVAGQTAITGYGSYVGVYGDSYGGRGVYGYTYATGGIGVVGSGDTGVLGKSYGFNGTTHIGVFGSGKNFGVLGQSNIGTGVKATTALASGSALYAYTGATAAVGSFANSTNGPAVLGFGAVGWVASLFASDIGVRAFGNPGFPAVQAISGSGPDFQASGSGRLNQVENIAGGIGAPNFTPTAGFFEMVRAGDGAMWVNRGQGTLKATWKRVNAVRVDSSDGAGTPFKPYRVFDTRIGAKRAAGSTNPVTVANTGTGTQNIPADAVAVMGNLTATQYGGAGFLAIMPQGTIYNPNADPSSLNFITGQVAIANSFICGLHAGQVQVYVGGSASHFIIDITGYMQ
jgi:hypothetical protein